MGKSVNPLWTNPHLHKPLDPPSLPPCDWLYRLADASCLGMVDVPQRYSNRVHWLQGIRAVGLAACCTPKL